jgi:hypothetical protein
MYQLAGIQAPYVVQQTEKLFVIYKVSRGSCQAQKIDFEDCCYSGSV